MKIKTDDKSEKTIKLENLKNKAIKEIDDILSKNAKNMVFGKGNPNADILFIGEAPGKKEDEVGMPFVGRAGTELNKMLNKIDLTLDDCYIANILKYRPKDNNDPNKKEMKEHTPYLIEQIKIIKPKIIATLGNFSTKFVLGNFNIENMKKVKGISELRGKTEMIKLNDLDFIVVPLYHPSAMMYNPKLREIFEKDFEFLKKIIKEK